MASAAAAAAPNKSILLDPSEFHCPDEATRNGILTFMTQCVGGLAGDAFR